ncbi:carboxylesterase/lipase family protein [Nocardia jiangxiensis]|uniref:Carboxylic ester hydrolase n=1 Tax=Nocardia jiangxiensis TaxID=282685 RepID=A0ABW6S9Z7_9NOCA|nr:carboxylesterase family protein [Nocardia jiangxiensis]
MSGQDEAGERGEFAAATRGENGVSTVVETAAGRVYGVAESVGAYAFRGIPYAASPVGELRFAPPRPHAGWVGVRDAAGSGPAVPQWPSRLESVMGARIPRWDEDGCLTVDVWVPQGESHTPRAVLLWFHGGGFTSGSGGWDWYDGGRLAALGDIIVVTANYRLGPLGYLRLPGVDNLGSQDQAAALRWVRENIAAFGGDPDLITVGGQSAGAFSAMALATDPDTGPAVRRVIGQSGPWGMSPQDPDEAAATAGKYLALLGIPDDGADPTPRLRSLPVLDLVQAYARLMLDTAVPGRIAPPLYPVLGGAIQSAGWRDLVPAGALRGKDVLLGATGNELGSFFALNPMIRMISDDAAVRLVGEIAGDSGESRYRQYLAEHPGARPAQALTAVGGEVMFGDDLSVIGEALAAQGNPAYLYRFLREPSPDPFGLGAAHCADLPYLFGTFDSYPNSPMLGTVGARDHALAAQFGGALAAFVATGSPNGPGLEPWKPWLPGLEPEMRKF